MAGKLMGGMKDLKIGNKQDQSTVKDCSSKSILSYQNGSVLNGEAGLCVTMESSPNKITEDESMVDSSCCTGQNLNRECLDIVRKKLISDLSLQVFCTDLENKIIKMEPMEITKERLSIIQNILVQINQLSDAEKLLLYLKLPSSMNSRADPLRQPLNPLGNRQEIQQTIVWIKTHLEEDREISIPKQDVYDQYLKYCENVSMKPLSTADFGKVMKQVYPGVRPRRLGTRGNSRYCYSGMRNTLKLPAPNLPQLVHPGKLSNGLVFKNGSSSVGQQNEKAKKGEKSKRKWKTSTNRSCKFGPSSRSSKMKDASLKYSKRSKVEKEAEEPGPKDESCQLKTDEEDHEEKSINSLNTLDNIACDLGNDMGICFDNVDRAENHPNGDIRDKVNLDLFSKIDFQDSGVGRIKPDVYGTPEKTISPMGTLELDKAVFDKPALSNINKTKKINYSVNDKVKVRRSNSFSKSQRSFKKSYVPIQPKPANNSRFKVHFDLDNYVSLRTSKRDSDVGMCEDSQEPEEEIVRYFQHLEGKQLLGPGVITVQNIAENAVQMRRIPQNVKSNGEKESDGRSRSCFENQLKVAKSGDGLDKFSLPQRSQSSVDFSERLSDRKTENCDRDKISHLRLLLEKSIVPENENNSKEVQSPRDMKSSHGSANANLSVVDRRLSKVDGSRSACDIFVPQSPNTSKYFNFTPISPGPRSPLKTPTTPMSSPFVSPRNTPLPRSRQNSFQNEFLPPSKAIERVVGIDDFSKVRTSIGNISDHQGTSGSRPRSNSSTNFYRPRRNLSKVLSCDRVSAREPRYDGKSTCFPFPPTYQQIATNDSYNKIREVVDNHSKVLSSRSQSVPLNRMISEGSWFSNQISPIFGHYMSSDGQGDYPGFVSEQKNLEPFIPNEQMLSLDQVNEVFTRDNQDINNIVQMSDSLFGDNFETGNSSSNSNNFSDNTIIPETVFMNKIDLNANATFPDTFPNESDSVMSENLKSYLDNVGGSMAKVKEKDPVNDVKLFNNSLYGSNNDKDPVITSFKPSFMSEFSSCPNSPVLGLFGSKGNDDSQFIEFLGLDG